MPHLPTGHRELTGGVSSNAGVLAPRKPFRLRWVFLPMLALVAYFVLLLLL
ncbi:hypothetical protein ACWEOI_21465 [Nocardia sp. NPDC004340]